MVPVDRSFLERIDIVLKQKEDEIMKYQDTRRALELYGNCPKCGNDSIGNGNILEIGENRIFRSCKKCSYSVTAILQEDGSFLEE